MEVIEDTYHVDDWWNPGPVYVRDEVREAMPEAPYGHRTPKMETVVANIREGTFELVGASNDTHSLVLGNGSGTHGLEIAARSWGDPRKKEAETLICSIGLFGDLWEQVYTACGVATEKISSPYGQPTDLETLETYLKTGQYKFVTATAIDTSTGTRDDLEQISELAQQYGVSFFVDAVSKVGGEPIDAQKLVIDYLVMAPQKAVGVPPSFTWALVSHRALANVVDSNGRGWSTDVRRHVDANNNLRILTTPVEAQMGACALQLAYILNEEDKEQRFARHTQMADMTRDWGEELDIELLPARVNAANTVSCFRNTHGVNLEAVRDRLLQNQPIRYGFDPGHEKFRLSGELDSFRIPTMGDHQPDQLADYLATVTPHVKP